MSQHWTENLYWNNGDYTGEDQVDRVIQSIGQMWFILHRLRHQAWGPTVTVNAVNQMLLTNLSRRHETLHYKMRAIDSSSQIALWLLIASLRTVIWECISMNTATCTMRPQVFHSSLFAHDSSYRRRHSSPRAPSSEEHLLLISLRLIVRLFRQYCWITMAKSLRSKWVRKMKAIKRVRYGEKEKARLINMINAAKAASQEEQSNSESQFISISKWLYEPLKLMNVNVLLSNVSVSLLHLYSVCHVN